MFSDFVDNRCWGRTIWKRKMASFLWTTVYSL